MWQAAVTYAIVAAAAAWIVWTLFLPTRWRLALRMGARRAVGIKQDITAGSGAACGCAREPR